MEIHQNYKLVFLICVNWLTLKLVRSHGRLMEPPSRASMWRVGFPTPADQDDNQAYCGGFGVQHRKNGGKCGICGDPWHIHPRPHEAPDGIYANGIITKTYRQGSLIPVIVDLTANHQGHFIFKLCPNNDIFHDPDQNCFDRYPLTTGSGNSVQYPINDYETGLRLLYVRLPLTVKCEQCILQWSYVGGNNWGTCANGTSGLGCGPQETFRSCADIRITPHPLLSPNQDLTSDFTLDEEENDLTIDFTELSNISDDGAAKRKVALLTKKKKILRRLLERIQELIILSQEKNDAAWNDENELDNLRSEDSKNKIFAPDENEWNSIDRVDVEEPWWEKIVSNRH